MKFLPIFLAMLLVLSLAPAASATLVVNKYTNDFTLSSPNNEQLKACSCGLKTDTLIVENVGNFYANYKVNIISPSEWVTTPETEFTLAPKHKKTLTVFVDTPCGTVGTYDYTVKVTSNYGREETLQRTIRIDQCQNIVLNVQAENDVNNLCQPTDYAVTVKNVGTYGEVYTLGFGSYDEYMNITNREFYLAAGQEYSQTATLTLPCEFYGEYEIPFIVFSNKNHLEEEQQIPLLVENQFDHSIDVTTQENVCSQVSQTIPITITNEIDVTNEFDIVLDGPNFVDVENNERTITLEGHESKLYLLEVTPQEGQEGIHTLEIEVESKYGEVKKQRDVELNVQNCYDFDVQVRDTSNNAVSEEALCCGSYEYFLNIQNSGQTSETYNIQAYGPSWFKAEKITVSLNPGENENVRLYAEVPCADEEYVIPVFVVNNRYNEVNETVYFTINAQTERTCHAVAIDDDEFKILQDTTVVPVVVKHNGIEGGVYDVNIDSELFTAAETQLTLQPGETGVLHLETKNLSALDFGRYITEPTFTYTAANNPSAHVSEDIDYVEHLGTQLRDKNPVAKFAAWLSDNWLKPGFCGWITILLILAIIALVLFLIFGRVEAKPETLQLARVLLLGGVVLVLILSAMIQLPDSADLYEMPDNPEEYFIMIYEGDSATIDLDQYFVDADNDDLAYVASQPQNVAVAIEDNVMTLTPDTHFTGENELVVTASDGNGGYEDSPVLKVYVLPEKELSFLGVWHRYCVQFNLALLLVALLLLLIITFLAKEKGVVVRKTPRRVVKTTAKKAARKTVAKKVRKKTAAKKAVAKKTVKKKATPAKVARKMTKEQRENLSQALDRALVSSEPHEIKQVLDTHGKRGTQRNITILQKALVDFKKSRYKPKNRESFYRYLKEKNVLGTLHNKQPSTKKTASKTAKKSARKSTRKTTKSTRG